MIKILSKNVSDKIAAGEVVDRPLSIVKELVENAIDAGAENITVEIRKGGKTYIRVTDDGCGIDEEQVEMAFLRHATSKISTDADLDNIQTLGFRGEALSSIAAVSRVELITKTADSKTGVCLKIYGGEVFSKTSTGCPDGTTMIVSDLFYNTPARLKFMKTDATESTLIIDFISKVALAYAHIKIRLINNGTILFSTNGKGDRYNNIITVYSKAVGDDLIYISEKNEVMSLEGYISRPDCSRTNRKQQIFFVNGRVITNKVMDIALHEGYKERLFEGRYPIAYLFFKIKPDLVDVNIHPNKKEVRFHQDTEVRNFIAKAVMSGLLSQQAVPQIKSDRILKAQTKTDAAQKTAIIKNQEAPYRTEPIRETLWTEQTKQTKQTEQIRQAGQTKWAVQTEQAEQTGQNGQPAQTERVGQTEHTEQTKQTEPIGQTEQEKQAEQTEQTGQSKKADQIEKNEKQRQQEEQLDVKSILSTIAREPSDFEYDTANPSAAAMTNEVEKKDEEGMFLRKLNLTGTIFNTYITAKDENCFYLIDQHAAHERIFYEQLLENYKSEEKFHQSILVPIIVEVPYTIKSSESSWAHMLKAMGFEIEAFGLKSYVVKAIPVFMGLSEAQKLLDYFLENIAEDVDIENEAKVDKIITKACKAAVKANDILSMAECSRLLEDLSRCRNPYSCPHGRPTFIKMTKYEIEKMFKRV